MHTPCWPTTHNTTSSKLRKHASFSSIHVGSTRFKIRLRLSHIAPAAVAQQFKLLSTEEELAAYLQTVPAATQLLGEDARSWQFQHLADGVINSVYAVHSRNGSSLLFKQAPPYVRSVGPSFPLSQERQQAEAAAMTLLAQHCPAHVPSLLHHDPHMAVLLTHFIGPPHQKLIDGIQQLQQFPLLAQQLSALLLASAAATSRLTLSRQQHAAAVQRFANTDMVRANEEVVLLLPFTPGHASNRWSSPELDPLVAQLWACQDVAEGAAELLAKYRSQRQALLHNDLHAGNLLVTQDSLHLIDWEFATYGPPAFDLGSLVANLLLARSCLAAGAAAAAPADDGEQVQEQQQQQQQQAGEAVRQQREWLLQVVQQLWEGVCRPAPGHGPSILEVMLADSSDSACGSSASADSSSSSTAASGSSAMPASTTACSSTQQQGSSSRAVVEGAWTAQQLQQSERQLLADSVGFAGMCMVRQVVGMHHYQGFGTIPDREARVEVERRCMQLGMELLVGRQQFEGVPSMLQCARRHDGA